MVTVQTVHKNLITVSVDRQEGNVRISITDSNNQNLLSVVYLTPDQSEVLESTIKVAGKAARKCKRDHTLDYGAPGPDGSWR